MPINSTTDRSRNEAKDPMLSRVADSLYWMTRYLERAEHTTRLLDVNLNLMLDESSASAEHRWQRVLQASATPKDITVERRPLRLIRTAHLRQHAQALRSSPASSPRAKTPATSASRSPPSSGTASTRSTSRSRARSCTPTCSAEAPWSTEAGDQPTEFLQQVMEAVHQFQGVTDSTMSHGEGWQFIQVGRYIERASATAMLLEAYHDDLWRDPDRILEGNEYLEWMGLLRSATAFEAYCKVYTADLTPDRILEFLLLDRRVPALRCASPSTPCSTRSSASRARAA